LILHHYILLKDYLPEREKDAYELIKEKLVIRDKISEPWQRVALRSIRDFAIPLKVAMKDGNELFWKWYLASNEEVKPLILGTFNKKQEIPKNKEKREKIKKDEKYNFKDKIFSYFSEKNINVLNEEVLKAKDVEVEVNLPSEIGLLKFFVKGVGKKRISDADLSLAYNKGQTKKLPILFLTEGELTKKAREYLKSNLEGYLIFRKI